MTNTTNATNTANTVSKNATTSNTTISQTRAQLFEALQKEKLNSKELWADIKAIANLIKEFQVNVGIPSDVSLGWAIKNRKAIFRLFKEIIAVLKTKNAI